jgi:hypothetical protein
VCHVSVGHIARRAELEGIPTVTVLVRSFRHVAQEMGYPRAVVTRHPMGRPLGPPGDTTTHRRVVGAALDLLSAASEGGALIEMADPYRPISGARQQVE